MDIPSESDWGDWRSDPDRTCAHRNFAGLTVEEAMKQFSRGSVIERIDEVRWMPPIPGRFYLVALARYIETGLALSNDDPASAASSFLDLVAEKLQNDWEVLEGAAPDLTPALEFVRTHQREFRAPRKIYGDFAGRVSAILQGLMP